MITRPYSRLSLSNYSDIIISLAIYTLLFLLFSSPHRMLRWDEVNYVQAARLGILANYLDSNSFSISYLLNLAFAKANSLPVPLPPVGYNEITDTFLLRHFHPPLLQYLSSIQSFIPPSNPYLATIVTTITRWLLGSILIVVAYIFPSLCFGRLTSLSARTLSTSIVVYSALQLSFALQYHVLLATSLVLVASCLFRALQNDTLLNRLLLSLSLSITILCLETSLVVLFSSFAISFLFYQYYLRQPSKTHIFTSFNRAFLFNLALPYAFSFILWPGSILKLSLIRSIGMYIYRLLWVREEYSAVFTPQTVTGLSIVLLPLLITSLLTLTLYFFNHFFLARSPFTQPQHSSEVLHVFFRLSPVFIALGLIYTLFMLPFVLNPTYLVPGLLIISLPLPYLLQLTPFWLLSHRFLKLTFISILIAFFTFSLVLKAHSEISNKDYPGWDSLASFNQLFKHQCVSDNDSCFSQIYADGGHILRFYLPSLSSKVSDISLIKRPSNLDNDFQLYTRSQLQYKILDLDSLPRPLLLLLRERNSDVSPYLLPDCPSVTIPGLSNDFACILH